MIVLASTLHDPENQLKELIIRLGNLIIKTFKSSYIVVTPTTHPRIIKTLETLEFKTSKDQKP